MGAVEGTASELPVELVSFEALTDGRDVLLQWGTASETNNAGFYVEMSTGATRAFESLAFVDGRGTTAVPQVYRFHVEHLEPDRYVFRLKQIDYDGTFDFSPEVEVVIAPPDAFRLTAVYPNPFNPRTRFSLMVKRRQHVTVAVYNVQGHRVRTLYEGEMQARQADLV